MKVFCGGWLKRGIHLVVSVGATQLIFNPAFADNWSFQVEPYALITSIDGDATVGRAMEAPVDVNFDDILEVLEFAAMLHFEAHHESGWGVVIDYGFMDLGADISGPRGGVVDADVRQAVFEAGGLYRSQVGGGVIDYMVGIRWWDNDIDIKVDPAILPGSLDANVEEDWVDVFVGARWIAPVNEQWDFVVRGDIGGGGLEADFTSSVALGFQYSISQKLDIDLQYKATWVDYEDGDPGQPGFFAYDTVTHGPLIGLIINF